MFPIMGEESQRKPEKDVTCKHLPKFYFSKTSFVLIHIKLPSILNWASLVSQTVKSLPTVWETWVGSPGKGNGKPLQYSYLENPMDGEAW